jgi:hypothetical protein
VEELHEIPYERLQGSKRSGRPSVDIVIPRLSALLRELFNPGFSLRMSLGKGRQNAAETLSVLTNNRDKRLPFAHEQTYDDFFRGTLAPFFRASESPIAIACFRLFTVPPFPPFPDLRVPFFFRRMALSTALPAAFPYLLPDFFFVLELVFFGMKFSSHLELEPR